MNEKVIWDFLYSKFKNPYAVAALMGNLYVESKLNPKDLQGSYERKFGLTDEEYTAAVDEGTYTSFIRDGAGYGLVQWTFWSRKEGLYNYAKQCKTSIGDLQMQLNYLWDEIQKYKTVFNAMFEAKDIRSISDIICEKYERSTNQTEKGKQTRADYGKKFYDMFVSSATKDDSTENKAKTASKKVVILKDRVNLRAGNGTNFPRISQVNKNAMYEWVATSENGWHAIKISGRVVWVSGEFSKVQ